MNIRQANVQDYPQIAALRWQHEADLRDVSPYDQDQFTRDFCLFLESDEGKQFTIWIMEEDGQVIANLFIRLIRKVPKPQRMRSYIGYVTNIQTTAEYRSRGLGSQLLWYVQAWAKQNEVELIFLWPSKRAVPFYLRNGFTQENEIMECLLLD